MIDPIAVGLTKEYVSKYDVVAVEKDGQKTYEPNPNPTVWMIGAIDSIEKAKIQNSWMDVIVAEDGKTNIVRNKDKVANSDFEIVRYGLKGFKNFGSLEFRTEKQKFFDRDIDVVAEDIIRSIPLDIIRELAEVIWNDNHVDRNLRKN